ncbi:MAG: 4Fe-4S dicluster domain-containing protein [Desulfobacterales bacterium]|nr:MAG: 4Fe-4S dicluster domain-containing protein [Desulfobacterales bacterium]
MEWTKEAAAAIKKVPFFVRKRVRTRVENEAQAAGKQTVTLADVRATQARYLSQMSSEIKGYQIDACFGPSGCPNRANTRSDKLLERIEALLQAEDLLGFLQQKVPGDLKFHHEFRITLADCPNACSQPQIRDIGIIGACVPIRAEEDCALCEACVEACKEEAIRLDRERGGPIIADTRCLNCGQCIPVCPTGTIAEGRTGFRVQLGGKLGRHPQLAKELPGIYNEKQVLQIVKDCVDLYKKHSRHGERFAHILQPRHFRSLAERYKCG